MVVQYVNLIIFKILLLTLHFHVISTILMSSHPEVFYECINVYESVFSQFLQIHRETLVLESCFFYKKVQVQVFYLRTLLS